MIRSSITVCLVPEARRGPFVFHQDLRGACRAASMLGFDAIEIFAPNGRCVDRGDLRGLLDRHGLQLAAVGTGAGMLLHGHSLSSPDSAARQAACNYAKEIIDFGAAFGAPAIIGSMQGQAGGSDRTATLENLAGSLEELSLHAAGHGTELFFEPLNRYETDLIMTLADGARLIERTGSSNLRLLADLFHMNIEETRVEQSITENAAKIGHLHFVDSNRSAAGFGHLDFEPIASALKASGYSGFASAEAFPRPDAMTAAEATIKAYRQFLAA